MKLLRRSSSQFGGTVRPSTRLNEEEVGVELDGVTGEVNAEARGDRSGEFVGRLKRLRPRRGETSEPTGFNVH